MKRDLFVFAEQPSRAAGTATAWRSSLAALALAVAWIVACYASTAASMVRTWANTETYAHGFVVVPISALSRTNLSALSGGAGTTLPISGVKVRCVAES